MLHRRIERLERGDDAGAALVGVVIFDGEDEDKRITEEIERRGIRPERANVAIVRVPEILTTDRWTDKYTGGSPEKEPGGR